DDMGVGRLLVVLEPVAASGRGDANRVVGVEAPAADVDRVDAVVAELAVAPVPEPVPVVVQDVVAIRPARRWSLPEGIVEPLGEGHLAAAAARGPGVAVAAAGELGPADRAAPDPLDGLDDLRPAPPLVAHLDDPVMLAGRRDQQLALAGVVAARFLD